MKLRVLLIDQDEDRGALLRGALDVAGFAVVVGSHGEGDLINLVRRVQPDVIVMDVNSPDRDTLENMCCIARDAARPVVMFTHDDDNEKMRAAIRAGVSAYVVGSVASERVKPIVDVAVMRFEQHQALRNELEQAKASLVERKVIDRAKGVIMRQRQCDEETAYRALRKLAMDRNRRLVDVAQSVLDAAELLG